MIRLSILFTVLVLFLMSLPMMFGYGKCRNADNRICDDLGIVKSAGRNLANKYPMQVDGDRKGGLLNLIDESRVLFSGRIVSELRYSDSFGKIEIDMGAARGALNVVASNMSEYVEVPVSFIDVVDTDSRYHAIKGSRLAKGSVKPGTWVMARGTLRGGVVVLNTLYIPTQLK